MGLIQNGVLAVLARNPGDHAYSVWQSLNTSASAEPVRLASVYMAVKRMKEMGVIRERDAGDFSEWGSLSQSERANFAKLVTFLSRRMGKTIVIVEHDLDLVWGVADAITVMDAGRVVATGAPEDVARDPAVQHMFVGGRRA